MKKYTAITLVSLALSLGSCSNFLDVKPTNAIEAESAITTAADAKVVINGLMRNMTSSNYYGRNFPLYADVKGGDLTVLSQGRGMDYLYTFNHSASANAFNGIWSQGFNCIAQINNLLENVERIKAAGTLENFDPYIGQALTARAITNFDLVRLYGKSYNDDKKAWGIPNITTKLASNSQMLRNTVEENYAQILTDLLAAEPLLAKAKGNGYINYYANKAMQARVYLYMENYAKALEAAEVVINSGVYKLYENGAWVDSWKKEFSDESIFELAIYPSEGDLLNNSLGAYFRRRAHGSSAILGYFMASTDFLNRFNEDPTDVRLGIMSNDETSTSRLGTCYKYSGSTSLSGDKNSSNNTAVNIKVIRLSEVYLIAAEAALATDKTKAASYLNAIRKRSANLAPATAATVSLDLIALERSKELYGEGHRFFDMIRWNKTITFDDDFGGFNVTQRTRSIDRTFYKTLLPIAVDEINANPGIAAQQNPGYGN